MGECTDKLKSLVKKLHNQAIQPYFAEVQDSVLEFSAKIDLLNLIGENHLFSTVDVAVYHVEATQKGEN